MPFFQEVMVLLWGAVCVKAACSNDTICVTIQNGSETECQHYSTIIYKLSDLEVNGTNCKSVHIYLTSGIHILHVDLYFYDSVQETEIHGVPHGPPSIIECRNNSGIRFSENESANKIVIYNVMFLRCQRFRESLYLYSPFSDHAALYLKKAMYTLSSVTVKYTDGWGLYVDDCSEQIIFNCTFSGNEENTLLGTHFRGYIMSNISIANSTFTNSYIGAEILGHKSNVTVVLKNNIFSHNEMSGVHLQGVSDAEISGCSFSNNNAVALQIASPSHVIAGYRTVISKVNFFSNYRAISLDAVCIVQTIVYISECIFTNHTGFEVIKAESSGCLVSIVLENSSIQGNILSISDYYIFCSILDIQSINNFTLSDTDITDNNCTGISISDSNITIQNSVNLTRNHGLTGGGGIYISDFSTIIFAKSSKLSLINNTAVYGGGIYTDGITYDCFFGFEDDNNYLSDLLVFSGNIAEKGGDAMFRNGLFYCYTSVDGNDKILSMHMCSHNTPFRDFVSSTNIVSQSTYAEEPTRVMFCTNATSYENSSSSDSSCTDTYSISVYRGQTFTVSLMLADDCCFPTAGFIEAKLKHSGRDGESPLQFKHGPIQTSRKYCDNFSYTLVGGLGQQEMNATVEFVRLLNSDYLTSPAILRVHVEECPIGYEINIYGECSCKDKLKAYKIECNPSNVSLKIPAHTWVGVMNTRSRSIAVQNDCQYCKSKEVELIITKDSNLLCTANRAEIMCGACVTDYSLQLGGYECADCSNFTYKGVLLLIAFTVIGIALVLLLLGLNLTVSTGMINGLIFYSNIVYLNSDTLLPTTREDNSTHLQNTVTILSTFQAWVNLDFGIVTCFFDGYDTYISTWMQFVFPLYIWLLILIIVLANRYSSRISRITTSNTVSVLATLLLLSYAKLLKTSIEAFSSVKLQLLDGNMTRDLWKPDANIPYLGQLHLPLFLISLVMVIVYVIPFTLLILLRPLLLLHC